MRSIREILTPQEHKAFCLVATGSLQKEIADKLCKSTATVSVQLRSVHEKLNVNKATELSRLWFCEYFNITKEQVEEKLRELGALTLMLLFFTTLSSLDDDMIRRSRRGRRRTEQEQTT